MQIAIAIYMIISELLLLMKVYYNRIFTWFFYLDMKNKSFPVFFYKLSTLLLGNLKIKKYNILDYSQIWSIKMSFLINILSEIVGLYMLSFYQYHKIVI